jgi:hypothetical protein
MSTIVDEPTTIGSGRSLRGLRNSIRLMSADKKEKKSEKPESLVGHPFGRHSFAGFSRTEDEEHYDNKRMIKNLIRRRSCCCSFCDIPNAHKRKPRK